MKWKLGTSSNVAGKLCILWCYDDICLSHCHSKRF